MNTALRDRGPEFAARVESRDRVRLSRRRARPARLGHRDGPPRWRAAPGDPRRREHAARLPARRRARLPLPRDRRPRHQRRCAAGLPRRRARPGHRRHRPARGADRRRRWPRPGSRGEHAVPTMAELLGGVPGLPVQHRPQGRRSGAPAGGAARPHAQPTTGSASGSFSAAPAERVPPGDRRPGGHVGDTGRGRCLPRVARRSAARLATRNRVRCPAGPAPSGRLPSSPRGSYDGRTPPALTCTCGRSTSPRRWTSCSTWASTA